MQFLVEQVANQNIIKHELNGVYGLYRLDENNIGIGCDEGICIYKGLNKKETIKEIKEKYIYLLDDKRIITINKELNELKCYDNNNKLLF